MALHDCIQKCLDGDTQERPDWFPATWVAPLELAARTFIASHPEAARWMIENGLQPDDGVDALLAVYVAVAASRATLIS